MSHHRAQYKGWDYFDQQVTYNESSIAGFESIIFDSGTSEIHRNRLRYTVFRRRLEDLITRYSRGDAVGSLKGYFKPIVYSLQAYHSEARSERWDFDAFDNYGLSIWLVSLAYLLEVEDELFSILVGLLKNESRDALYERIVSFRIEGRPTSGLLIHPKQYGTLWFAIVEEDLEKRLSLIGKFLSDYYRSMKRAYWHDNHEGPDSGYFGYWCFELAAVVKGLKIEDQTFAKNKYYPADIFD